MSEENGTSLPIYGMDLQKVARSPKLNALCRFTATTAMANQYIPLGEWLEQLHSDDLSSLISSADRVLVGNQPTESFVTTVILLAIAEGIGMPESEQHCYSMVSQFIMLLSCEAMSRAKLGVFHREFASLSTEHNDKQVLELTEAGHARAESKIQSLAPKSTTDKKFPNKRD